MLNKVGTIHKSLSNSSLDIQPLEINPLSITGAVLLQAEQAGLQEYLSGQLSLPCVQPRISREQINTISEEQDQLLPLPLPYSSPRWVTENQLHLFPQADPYLLYKLSYFFFTLK